MQASSGLQSDVIIELLADDVGKSSGISIDIGSSTGKLLYRPNKEYRAGKPINVQADPAKGQMHFAMFPRSDLDGMIKYLKENADLTPNEEGITIVKSSGVGGASFQKDIENGLNCKMEIAPESDCFGRAFLALEKIRTKEELFISPSAESLATIDSMVAQIKEMRNKTEGHGDMDMGGISSKAINSEDRPRLLVMAGSGTGVIQINKDETLTLANGIYTSGRTMYGLAAYLTGENDFSKLLEMAEASDGKTADIWASDLMPKKEEGKGEENMYTSLGEVKDFLLFPFGKGVTLTQPQTKKCDMAFSAFSMIAQIHADSILQTCRATGATEVYICGNVFNSEFMRDRILINKSMMESMFGFKQPITFNFIKDGGCLGALGAMLTKKKAKEDKPAK